MKRKWHGREYDGWVVRQKGKSWFYPWTLSTLKKDAIRAFETEMNTRWTAVSDQYEAVKVRADIVL